MRPSLLLTAAALVALALVGFFRFPGHTWLQSDTQIYGPMLIRLWDPAALSRDLVATRPHLAYSFYDEVSLALRLLTGLSLQHVLQLQQILWRILALTGVYLLARAMSLSRPASLFVAGAFGLGATIVGPSVLTLEYEPVPRAFAVCFLMGALGFAANGRWWWAAAVAAGGFFYHPPTGWPFWVLFAAAAVTGHPVDLRKGARKVLLLVAVALAIVVISSRFQPGATETQVLFGRVDPELETIQRGRASYNWVSVWTKNYIGHHLALWAVSLAAAWRLRRVATHAAIVFLVGMPLVGMLSIPLSFLLLEQLKWSLVPQAQLARAILFVTAFASLGAAAAAARAARERNYVEAFLFLLAVFAIPTQVPVTALLWPSPLTATLIPRMVLIAALSAIALAALAADARGKRWAPALIAAVVVAAVFAIPSYGKVRNYPALHHAELDELAAWARASTPKDAMFLFPDLGRGLEPGMFRVMAERALYVDYKSGGQANFHRQLAFEWWSRWQKAVAEPYRPRPLGDYAALGIDFIVLQPQHRLASDPAPAFRNSRYLVYNTRP